MIKKSKIRFFCSLPFSTTIQGNEATRYPDHSKSHLLRLFIPIDTGHKLNVHKTFRRRDVLDVTFYERLMNVEFTFCVYGDSFCYCQIKSFMKRLNSLMKRCLRCLVINNITVSKKLRRSLPIAYIKK